MVSVLDPPSTEVVKLWWPVPVLQKTYAPPADAPVSDTPELHTWIEAAANELITAILRRTDTRPKLELSIGDYDFAPAGRVPRRTPAAVLGGVFCLDPGPVSVERAEAAALTFQDPRSGAEMIPGTAAPANPVRTLRLGINGLILFPGWLAQGHTAPVSDRYPRWLRVWFGPPAFKGQALTAP